MPTNPSNRVFKRSILGHILVIIAIFFYCGIYFETFNPLPIILSILTILLFFKKLGCSTKFRVIYSIIQFFSGYILFILASNNYKNPNIEILCSTLSIFLGVVFVSIKGKLAMLSTFYEEQKSLPTDTNYRSQPWSSHHSRSSYYSSPSSTPSYLSPVNPMDENIPPTYDDVLKEL